jgi:HK97 family phage prohead protease
MATTSSPDREGDRVLPSGAELGNFLKNPVLLFSHQARELLPIGAVTSLELMATGIKARWTWLKDDPFAMRCQNAWDQGMLRAASIGFIPKEMTPNDSGGMNITRWELLELSLCAIPANPQATRTLKALGLLTETEAIRLPDESVIEIEGPMDVAAATIARVVSEAMAIRVAGALTPIYAGVEIEGSPKADEWELEIETPASLDVEPKAICAAVRTSVGMIVKEEITAAMNYARGRVD